MKVVKEIQNMKEQVISYGYDRAKIKAGIVHIGVGNFHRALEQW
jgi:mannitol 2-dehydrogenase